jgi:5-methyltetrahydrofolate--homocysteine methyltransferase
MVEAEKIADEASRNNVDAIGLSGLITPSLDEMIRTVRELKRRGIKTPVLIGGATTSRLHTAVKIAPEYEGVVVHSRDASENVRLLAGLSGPDSQKFAADIRAQQQIERELHNATSTAQGSLPLARARQNAHRKQASEIAVPLHTGRMVFSDHSIDAVEPYINWSMLYAAWQVRGVEQREQLRADAEAMLRRIKDEHALRLEGVAGIFPARRGRTDEGPGAADDIVVSGPRGREIRLAQLRSQATAAAENLSLADYVVGDGTDGGTQDYIGAFALTAGVGLAEFTEKLRTDGDDYGAIMAKLLADRLTEAFAEAVHEFIRRVSWGYQRGPDGEPVEIAPRDAMHGKYRGLRFALGYPATPDHSLKEEVFELLGVTRTTSLRLTDNYMISPGESLCGLIVADPDAAYFTLGTLSDEQIEDYARRRGKSPDEIRRLTGERNGR